MCSPWTTHWEARLDEAAHGLVHERARVGGGQRFPVCLAARGRPGHLVEEPLPRPLKGGDGEAAEAAEVRALRVHEEPQGFEERALIPQGQLGRGGVHLASKWR